MGIPLIPAPAAMCALLIGVMLGVVIERKKLMHGMGMMHGPGMMKGMGPGMMGGMAGHHHHGEGTPPCDCGQPAAEEPDTEPKA